MFLQNEAQQIYYEQLGISKDRKFLKRPESEEEMYHELNNDGESDDGGDEDDIINQLESNMVNASNNDNANK